MPCKAGTRASMEASKAAAQRERMLDATDPFQIYWHHLVDRVHGSSAETNPLSDAEQQYWAVGCLIGEVHNGGFDQYFYNSSGATYLAAIDGLQAMSASTSLLLLQKAKKLIFGLGEVPVASYARRTLIATADGALLQQRLDRLDRQFWTDPDELAARSEAFAVTHGLVRRI